MKQALHIFTKDVRGLAYEAALTLALIVAFIVTESRTQHSYADPPEWWAGALKALLPISWWVLTARLIQAEPIPGDQQFWITRPYSWKSLLAAKIGFLIAFISIPMMISDAIALHAQGFPVASHAGGILWEMLLRFGVILMLVTAASMTKDLGGYAAVCLIVLASLLFSEGYRAGRGSERWSDIDWAFTWTMTLLIPAAILFQYARRRRIALIFAVCAWLLPLVSARIFRPERPAIAGGIGGLEVQFKIDSHPNRTFFPRSSFESDQIPVVLPIEISGIPEGLQARANQIVVKSSTDGKIWQGEFPDTAVLTPDQSFADPRFFWLELKVPRAFYEAAAQAGSKVVINAWVDLTIYRNLVSTAVGEGDLRVPRIGYCRAAWQFNDYRECRSPLRHPAVTILVYDSAGNFRKVEFPGSPFPAELGVSAIVPFAIQITPNDTELVSGEPVFHLQRSFYLNPVSLGDYVEPRAK